MTLIEAAKLALEAMESAIKAGDWIVDGACDPDMALVALHQAISEAEGEASRQPWVGLTDEGIDLLLLEHDMMAQWPTQKQIRAFANAIEAKLKEKNT